MTLTFYGRRIMLGRKKSRPIDAHVFSLRCDEGHEPLLLVRHQHLVFVLDPVTLHKAAVPLPDGVETSAIIEALEWEETRKPFTVSKGTTLRNRLRELVKSLNIREQN